MAKASPTRSNASNDWQDERLLSAKDLAEILGCSQRSIWRLCSSGRLPSPVRLGPRLVRWRAKDVERWLGSLADTT